MTEQGITLGRLVAAERNASTAIHLGLANQKRMDKLLSELETTKRQLQQSKEESQNLRSLVIATSRLGTGPTA